VKQAPILLALLSLATTAHGQGFDRLGSPTLQTVDLCSQPASAASPGWLLRASFSEPFLEAGIVEQRFDVQGIGSRFGMAAQLRRQGSDIHARTGVGVALRYQSRGQVWGFAASLDQWSFAGGVTRQRWQARLAWSRSLGTAAMLGVQLQPPLFPDDRATVRFLLSSSSFSPFHLVFHEQRVAGLAVTRQFGVVWSNASAALGAGYNAATMATSVGIFLSSGMWSWGASGRAHPFLGSGRQWGLAVSP